MRLPRLTEGETVHLWLQVGHPVDTMYGLSGGASPEDVGKRLRELQLREAPLQYLNPPCLCPGRDYHLGGTAS